MRSLQRWRRWLADEKGISLIEILGAVTILSIISVTLMGYFISGLEKSADASRRNIAANLARLKAAEIRELTRQQADFDQFASVFAADGREYSSPLPSSFTGGDPQKDFLRDAVINGTTYRYLLQAGSKLPGRFQTMNSPFVGGAAIDQYLLPFSITVYWDGETERPRPAKKTSLDSYIINREERS